MVLEDLLWEELQLSVQVIHFFNILLKDYDASLHFCLVGLTPTGRYAPALTEKK